VALDVNVNGVWFVAREAARGMIAAGTGGSTINAASITGLRPGVSATAYSASKAAVIQMTKALAMEWARHGIRVNALAPGYFETDLNRALLQSDYGQQMMKRIPQRRFGDVSDLDGPILLLASGASAFMTGSVIEVDGGHLGQCALNGWPSATRRPQLERCRHGDIPSRQDGGRCGAAAVRSRPSGYAEAEAQGGQARPPNGIEVHGGIDQHLHREAEE
jgi:hypothetical protein